MEFSRRSVLGTMTAAAVASPMVTQGTATATDDVVVSGQIDAAVDTSIEGNQVVLVHQETIQWYRAEIKSDGTFQELVPEDASYWLTYFHEPLQGDLIGDFDGVPVIQDLDDVDLSQQGTDLGSYTVPEGFVAKIRIVDGDGNPLENVPLSFYVPDSGNGTGPRAFTTDANGQVVHANKTEPGIELRGKVTVRTHPPGGEGGETLGTMFIDEAKQLEMVLRNPEDYDDIIVHDSSGSSTETATDTPAETATDTPTETATPTPRDTATQTPTASEPTPTMTESSSNTPTQQTMTPTPAGTATPASQSEDDQGAQRGFFSNSAEGEPEFLSNVFNLTMLGFLLSVGGIIHQMMEG